MISNRSEPYLQVGIPNLGNGGFAVKKCDHVYHRPPLPANGRSFVRLEHTHNHIHLLLHKADVAMGKYFFNPGSGEHWISVRLLLIKEEGGR